jgi:streptogramin lyase
MAAFLTPILDKSRQRANASATLRATIIACWRSKDINFFMVYRKMIRLGSLAPLFLVLLLARNVRADERAITSTNMQTHTITGAALNIVAEAPGRIWFTMPENNAIGRLVVTTTVSFTEYGLPTANSQPYDLAYAEDAIWFTERAGNKLGRLDVATGAIEEFSLPTANSEPTGIAISPGGYIWYSGRNSNRLGRYLPASNTFEEFLFAKVGAQFEDVAAVSDTIVWATAPALNEVAYLDLAKVARPATTASGIAEPTGEESSPGGAFTVFLPAVAETRPAPFLSLNTAPYERPMQVVIDNAGLPWFTLQDSGFVLRYAPGTLSLWHPYALPDRDGGPVGLAYRDNGATWSFWYTQSAGGQAGHLLTRFTSAPISVREQPLPGPEGASAAQPWGIAIDANEHVWIAAQSNTIIEWSPPYFEFSYVPTLFAGG